MLEVKGSSVGAVINFVEKSEDELVFSVEAESAGSHESVSDVGSSLSGVSVKAEESVKFSNVIG